MDKDNMAESRVAKYQRFEDAVKKGWGEWQKLDTLEPEDITEYCGVYEIATTRPFNRLKGTTTTLYIGKSLEAEDGLRARLGNFNKRPSFRRTLKKRIYPIRDELSECLWIRFRVIDPDEVNKTEKKLLEEFEQAHLELPPCNRSG